MSRNRRGMQSVGPLQLIADFTPYGRASAEEGISGVHPDLSSLAPPLRKRSAHRREKNGKTDVPPIKGLMYTIYFDLPDLLMSESGTGISNDDELTRTGQSPGLAR